MRSITVSSKIYNINARLVAFTVMNGTHVLMFFVSEIPNIVFLYVRRVCVGSGSVL